MNAVVQFIFGSNPVYDISQKTWQAFCRRTGTAYQVIERPPGYGPVPDLYYAKWDALRPVLQHFDRTLVVDADTFCLPTCDAEFFGKPGDPIGAVRDRGGLNWISHELFRAEGVFGVAPFSTEDYVNAGFVVLGREHEKTITELLSYRDVSNRDSFSEQTALNHLLFKQGFTHLPFKYNTTMPEKRSSAEIQEALIIHCNSDYANGRPWMQKLWDIHKDVFEVGSVE